MVQAKHKKSKPKKQHAGVKKHGKHADIGQFHSQLDALGLKIIRLTADGNCFFRALADQLEGNEEEHKKYRHMVVKYILNHRADFEAFIEDDVPFDEYCQSMEEDGTWAGNMELQAASLVTRRNICIHRIMSPRWYIRNFSGQKTSMIHLSYHDGEHYNSVRLIEDSCEGPAMPIIIKVDANISAVGHNEKVTTKEFKGSSCKSSSNSGTIKFVMAGSGCENFDKVEQILLEVDGDADAAIEFLIAEKEMMEDNSDGVSSELNGDNQNGNNQQSMVESDDVACEGNISSTETQSVKDCGSQQDDKKIARKKECSCGSRKNYKACCGSAVGKFSGSPVSNNRHATGKGKKDAKRNRRREATKEVSDHKSVIQPDLGALCI